MMPPKHPIETIIAEIIEAFAPLQAHPMLIIEHLITLGEGMPPLADKERKEKYQLKGCLSKTWLLHTYEKGHLYFRGDSEAKTTKGLLSLAIRLFSGQTPHAIHTAKNLPMLLEKTNLHTLLTTQRQGGFLAMIAFMREVAKRY